MQVVGLWEQSALEDHEKTLWEVLQHHGHPFQPSVWFLLLDWIPRVTSVQEMGKEWLWFNRKLKHMTGKPKDRKVFTTVIRSVDDASWGCFCKIKLFRIFILQMKCGFKTEK